MAIYLAARRETHQQAIMNDAGGGFAAQKAVDRLDFAVAPSKKDHA
jgi:hypothetical protein